MSKAKLATIALLLFAFIQPGNISAQKRASLDNITNEIIAIERAALDRYESGDPDGYLNLYTPEVTYFDPMTERRVDGQKAMQDWLAPVRTMKPPFTDRRYELISPKVQLYGDVALLTCNLINYGKPPNKAEQIVARWNITEVYRRINGKWVIVHSHFSFIKPNKAPGV